LGAAPDEVLVGIVGRLTEIKNHSLFLRAAALFKEARGTSMKGSPRVRFVVVGDGHLRAKLEDEARTLGLAEDIAFLGTRDDPENFYPALDVVCLTSLNEGTPLTLIEAMANGRAVVATAVGGVVDLLGNKAQGQPETLGGRVRVCERGLLVSPNDAEAFCGGLAELVKDEGLRRGLGERGARFVAENYSKGRLLSDITRLYAELTTQTLESTVNSRESKVQSAQAVAQRSELDSRLQTRDS
jgi:glycosyltransferase involved in cell wall biosynthesis